jgi:hypothetical protein
MMFLLRSAFWLSIVYAHMPFDESEALRALDETRGAVTASATSAAATRCAADRDSCRALIGAATRLIVSPAAPRAGGVPAAPVRTGGKAKGERSSVTSLTASDLAPPWHGAKRKSGV